MKTTTNLLAELRDCIDSAQTGLPENLAGTSLDSVLADADRILDELINHDRSVCTALAAEFAAREEEASACSGGSYGDPDVPAPLDPDQAENYGAAQAWGEAASRVAFFAGTGIPVQSDLLDHVLTVLRLIMERDGGVGEGNIVADACADAITVLVEATTEEGAPAVDLLDLARRHLDVAIDGRQASVGSLVIAVESLSGQAVGIDTRSLSRGVNNLYGAARRVR